MHKHPITVKTPTSFNTLSIVHTQTLCASHSWPPQDIMNFEVESRKCGQYISGHWFGGVLFLLYLWKMYCNYFWLSSIGDSVPTTYRQKWLVSTCYAGAVSEQAQTEVIWFIRPGSHNHKAGKWIEEKGCSPAGDSSCSIRILVLFVCIKRSTQCPLHGYW